MDALIERTKTGVTFRGPVALVLFPVIWLAMAVIWAIGLVCVVVGIVAGTLAACVIDAAQWAYKLGRRQ